MVGKRGQEGMSLSTLLALIIGIVVVVVVILGFTMGWDYVFGIFNQLPEMEKVVQICAASGQAGLQVDYCRQFRTVEIDGAENAVTCSYLGELNYLTNEQKLEAGCAGFDSDVISKEYCRGDEMKEKDWNKIKVNGQTCKSRLSVAFADRVVGMNCKGKAVDFCGDGFECVSDNCAKKAVASD